MAWRMLRGRPFAGVVIDAPQKWDENAFTIHGGDVGEKAWVVKTRLDGVGGSSTHVALNGLDVGLRGVFDALTFDYFLRVRREDRTRVL